jgi:hypothetical protein
MNNRQQIIKEIEELRASKVVTYITSDRPGITSMIDPTDLREIFDHIKDIPQNTKIDLFIYSRGGNSVTAWALANLIREHSNNFNVLIPYRAHSCATAIAIGSNEIVMGRMGELGPIDPTLSAFVDNKKVDVSTEDLSSYIAFLKEKFGIRREKQTIQAFSQLAENVKPLLLGRAYRSYLKARDDAMKLLKLHLSDEKKVKNIAEYLVEKLYAHDHIINRKEAKEHIDLNITFANGDLENKMWELYLEYEKELKLKEPYKDTPTTGADPRILPVTIIESTNMTSKKNIKQFIKEVNLPQQNISALPIIVDNKPALMFPGGQAVQIVTEGQAVVLNQKFFDKTETVIWEKE